MMTDAIAYARLVRLQERVYRCIEEELQRDDHHKSFEGAIEATLTFPPIFQRDEAPSWIVTLHAYVLPIEGRHQSWEGETLLEAVSRAEAGLKKMLTEYEFKRFDRQIAQCVDEPGEADGSTVIYSDPRPA